MTNERKRRRLSKHTRNTTPIARKSFSSNSDSEAYSSSKGKRKRRDNDAPSSSDHVANVSSNSRGPMSLLQSCLDMLSSVYRSIIAPFYPQPPPQPHQPILYQVLPLIIHHLYGKKQQLKILYQFTLVNKQFHAASNPTLWQVLNFRNEINAERFLACLSDASPQRLATLGHHILDLRLNGPYWTDDQLTRLLPHLSNLKHISIHEGTNLTDTSLQHLPSHCQYLVSLKLLGKAAAALTEPSFSAIGQYCHHLDEFVWFISPNQSPEWLAMLTSCPLETLHINSKHVPLNQTVMAIIQTFDRLTCLDITHQGPDLMKSLLLAPPSTGSSSSNQHDVITTTTTTNSTGTAATPLWPGLTQLTLNPCHDLDDETLIGFIKTHPHLQALDLMKGCAFTDTSLDAMAVWLPRLMHVMIAGNAQISADGVRRWIQHTRSNRLASISLRFCHGIAGPDDFPEWTRTTGKIVELDRHAIERIKLSQSEGQQKQQQQQQQQQQQHMGIRKRRLASLRAEQTIERIRQAKSKGKQKQQQQQQQHMGNKKNKKKGGGHH